MAAAPRDVPAWTWRDILPQSLAGISPEDPQTHTEAADATETTPNRHAHGYPPRTCRICLDTVYPTTEPPSEYLPGFLQSRPRVFYVSPDPEFGRLLRPCKCKGSSRYVHEGCLQSWRHADPSYGSRNYYQCPTCGFKYRFQRVVWSRWIASTMAQVVLTSSILLFTIFLLGFVADPIINLYLDPLDTIIDSDYWDPTYVADIPDLYGRATWADHFLKGLASLGVLSFVKAILAVSPFQWWRLRGTGLGSSGGRRTGRDRIASIGWLVILIGVGTFLLAVYKGVRHWARNTLEKASERVLDVQGEEDDEGEEVEPPPEASDHDKKDE
ncbi:RING finger domain protein [Talaromyces proteolyticus]|uniref:RING finger domain protein n=1 Tax=Talaromyces proteolyticus TaxID=1131652 RepID=A0AAD4Q1L4_9EURO|nr:RING finger domain protein [Talaromyces proteolyticus]KAH8705775.1 RING finger domain protein [Talaromyces proteolyticus]